MGSGGGRVVGQLNGSVMKAFEILSLFREGRSEISAATLKSRLGMNAVTAHRFLRTLEAAGMVVASSRGTYRPGLALADLGASASGPGNLALAVQPVLERLTDRIGEATMATLFDGEKVVCVARAVPDRPLFVDVRQGTRLEAHCTAHGKLWLAHLSPEALDRWFETAERRVMTARTVVSREALEGELAQVRETGLAFNRSEREADIHALAVPVLAKDGRMVCGLSVFGSAARLGDEILEGFADPLREAAAEIARRLYGKAPHEEPAC